MTYRTLLVLLGVAALAGCPEPEKDEPVDDTDTDGDAPDVWTTVASGLAGAVLSITGTSADDVWFVGSQGNGSVPTLIHWDGAAWDTIDTSGHLGDYWWGWAASEDDLWIAGAGGRVRRYQRSTDTWTMDDTTAENLTLFGIWGSSASDVWAVGGDIALGFSAAWHYDGAAWDLVDVPDEADAAGAIYKVWGRSADDVWMVGSAGLAMHWDGAAWTVTPTGVSTTLFTVSGDVDGTDVWAVGGQGNSVVLRWDGAAWIDETPPFTQTIPGIFGDGAKPRAAGYGGSIYVREGDAWALDPRGQAGFFDFHVVWEDDEGGVWGGGGVIASNPTRDGQVVYGGTNPPTVYAP